MSVVPLHGGVALIGSGQVRDDVVEALEDLLERAKSGDVVGLQVALLHGDGTTSGLGSGLTHRNQIGVLECRKALLVEYELSEEW